MTTDALNTICAISADSPRDIKHILEKMIYAQSGGRLSESSWHVDEAGLFGIAACGPSPSNSFYFDAANNVAAALAGRITNSKKLLEALEGGGNAEAAGGFAETLAVLYGLFGVDCVKHLQGSFSAIVLDINAGKTMAFRDRAGSLPLYYSRKKNGVTGIASRVETLVKPGIAGQSLNHEAIFYFLCDKAFAETETPYTDVRSLRAGELLSIHSGSFLTERFHITKINKERMSEEEAVDRAESLLMEVLEEQLEGSGEIGILFSGGVDSTLMLSTIKAISRKPIHTYSVIFDKERAGRSHIEEATKHFGARHTNIILDESTFHDNILNLIGKYPTPGIGSWHVHLGTQAAGGDGIRKVISGFGGEVVFGIHGNYKRLNRVHRILEFLDPADSLGKLLLESFGRLAGYAGKLFLPTGTLSQYANLRLGNQKWYGSKLDEKLASALFISDTMEFRRVREKVINDYLESESREFSDMLLYSRLKNFEGNKVLGLSVDVARSNEVELISPLLDRRMVEYGFSIPNDLKNGNGEYRRIENELARRYHGFQREKSAFIVPLDGWLRDGLPKEALAAFDPGAIMMRGIFKPELLQDIWESYRRGRSDLTWADIYTFISLEVWLRTISGS